jgi:hypothetical protein
VVVGVIPPEDSHDDRDVCSTGGGQGKMQGDSLDEVLHWPRPKEEQEVRVYTRRHHAHKNHVQVQGGKNTLLGENPEELTQPSTHDSSSSPSQKHGTLSLPLDDLGIPIAYTKKPRSTDGKLPPNLSQYDISNYVSYVSLGSQYKSFIAALDSTVPITRDWQETKQYPVLRAVMIEEMATLDKNNTWVLTTLPPNKKVVGCKWCIL